TGSLATARYKHAAVLLPDGRVAVVAGSNERQLSGLYGSVEIYDPATGRFSSGGSVNVARYKVENSVVLLPSGKLLVSGGAERAEVYDPATGKASLVGGSMDYSHFFQTGT